MTTASATGTPSYRLRLKAVSVVVAEPVVAYGDIAGRHVDAAASAASIAQAAYSRLELDMGVEHFVVLHLSARGHVIGYRHVATGTLTACLVHPREVFMGVFDPALRCAAIVVVHNHPSGDCSPSDEDVSLTARLVAAGELLGVPVVDHLIIASSGRYRSVLA